MARASGTNKWFTELFEGGAGVPVYVNHKFWAGMTTTQRAESIHAFFVKDTLPKRPRLVNSWNTALTRLWEREYDADHDSK